MSRSYVYHVEDRATGEELLIKYLPREERLVLNDPMCGWVASLSMAAAHELASTLSMVLEAFERDGGGSNVIPLDQAIARMHRGEILDAPANDNSDD
jgi:hypothetical protein